MGSNDSFNRVATSSWTQQYWQTFNGFRCVFSLRNAPLQLLAYSTPYFGEIRILLALN